MLFGALLTTVVFRLVSVPTQHRLKQRWSQHMLINLGVRIDQRGLSSLANCDDGLLVCNHVSFVDIIVINALLPSRFVAKSEVAAWPIIGGIAARAGTIFIARGSRRAAHETQQRMTESLRAGQRLAIFPEGTTGHGDHVMPFHGALFQAAVDAGVPVHCLALSYHDQSGARSAAPAYVGETSLVQCLRAIVSAGGITVRIGHGHTVAAPHADRRHLAHTAHTAVARTLAAIAPAAHAASEGAAAR